MKNCIFLKNYRKSIEIGAFQEERQALQEISVTIEAQLPDNPKSADDAVDDIVSYDLLVNAVDFNLAARRYDLLEALAEDIANYVLQNPGVASVRVEIQKLGRVDGALGVHITREPGETVRQNQKSYAHSLFFIYPEAARLEAPAQPSVYVFLNAFDTVEDNVKQHLKILELDALAWRASRQLQLPVVDSFTETESLLDRERSFIRGFGKSVFSASFIKQGLSEAGLIEWMTAEIAPKDVQIMK